MDPTNQPVVNAGRIHAAVRGKFVPSESELIVELARDYMEFRNMSYDSGIQLLASSGMKLLNTPLRGMFSYVQKHLPYRSLGSIYEHFMRISAPDRQRGKWSIEDEQKLITLVAEHGRNWSLICKSLGRLNQDVKDKWKLLERKMRCSGSLPLYASSDVLGDQNAGSMLILETGPSSGSHSQSQNQSQNQSQSQNHNHTHNHGHSHHSVSSSSSAVSANGNTTQVAPLNNTSHQAQGSLSAYSTLATLQTDDAPLLELSEGARPGRKWSEEEKSLLRQLVPQYRYTVEHKMPGYEYVEEKVHWKVLASHFQNRSVRSIQSEWALLRKEEHPDFWVVTDSFRLPCDIPEAFDVLRFIERLRDSNAESELGVSWATLYRPFRVVALQGFFTKLCAVNRIDGDFRSRVDGLDLITQNVTHEMILDSRLKTRATHAQVSDGRSDSPSQYSAHLSLAPPSAPSTSVASMNSNGHAPPHASSSSASSSSSSSSSHGLTHSHHGHFASPSASQLHQTHHLPHHSSASVHSHSYPPPHSHHSGVSHASHSVGPSSLLLHSSSHHDSRALNPHFAAQAASSHYLGNTGQHMNMLHGPSHLIPQQHHHHVHHHHHVMTHHPSAAAAHSHGQGGHMLHPHQSSHLHPSSAASSSASHHGSHGADLTPNYVLPSHNDSLNVDPDLTEPGDLHTDPQAMQYQMQIAQFLSMQQRLVSSPHPPPSGGHTHLLLQAARADDGGDGNLLNSYMGGRRSRGQHNSHRILIEPDQLAGAELGDDMVELLTEVEEPTARRRPAFVSPEASSQSDVYQHHPVSTVSSTVAGRKRDRGDAREYEEEAVVGKRLRS
eukprot:ANDGO_02387.mRNA.1 RNA polymerase I termination factor